MGTGVSPGRIATGIFLLSSFLFLLRPCVDRPTLGNASHCLAPGRSPYGFFCPHTVPDASILSCALPKYAAWTP